MFSFTEWNVWLWNKVSREENSWEKAYDMFRKPHKRLLLKSTCKNQSSWREEYGRFHTFYILIWNLKIYLIVFWETQCGLLWSIMWSWMTADILSSKGQTFALKIWWWLHIHHLLPFFSYDRSFKIAESWDNTNFTEFHFKVKELHAWKTSNSVLCYLPDVATSRLQSKV